MKRFQDQNIGLWTFKNEVLVVCPKCTQRAIVSRHPADDYRSKGKLKCPNCMHAEDEPQSGYRVELKCNCANCGRRIARSIDKVSEPIATLAAKCPHCADTRSYRARNINLKSYPLEVKQPVDPYYHLPLWLVETVRGNILWAYNHQHLAYLKSYITADLREKNGRQFWTMVERLPAWMKSAKNREAVTRAIEKLEKR